MSADGVVLGILAANGEVDTERTGELVHKARPLAVTFHCAFDMTREPFAALEALISMGIERVLTSGREASVLEGADLIAELVTRAAGKIIIMPGGGITERNVAKIVARTGVQEIHAASFSSIDGQMRYRNQRCFMSGELRPPEFALSVTDPARIRELVGAIRRQPAE